MCNILIFMLQILNIMFLHRCCQDSQANLYLWRVENINLSEIFHKMKVLIFPELILVPTLGESQERVVNTRCHCFRFPIHELLFFPATSLSFGNFSSHSVPHLAPSQLKALQVDFPFPSEFQLSCGTVFHVFLIICPCVMSLQGQYGSPKLPALYKQKLARQPVGKWFSDRCPLYSFLLVIHHPHLPTGGKQFTSCVSHLTQIESSGRSYLFQECNYPRGETCLGTVAGMTKFKALL